MTAAVIEVAQATTFYKRRWLALVILCMSLMLVMVSATVVNVAIPSIVEDFDATFRDAEWVNTIYSLIYAATLILWGKVGDQFGRRLMFILGAGIFGIGTILVGMAQTIGLLVLMRAVQGIGAAMLTPSTLSIITTTFKGKERGMAFGLWGATAGVAAAVGPLLGGWVIVNASWRWAFYITIPIIAVCILGAFWVIAESRNPESRRKFDITGALLGGGGLTALVFGLIEGQTYGWWTPTGDFTLFGWHWPLESFSIVPVSLVISVVLLGLFAWCEMRLEKLGQEPLFEFGMLRYASYKFGLLVGMIVNMGEIGLVFALSLYLQGTQGLTAFETGVAVTPLAIAAFIAAPLAGIFASKIGPKWIVVTGMALEVVALLWLGLVIAPGVSVKLVGGILIIYGLGMGLAVAQLTSLVLYDIPDNKSGVASGGNSTIRQVGATLGIALIGSVLTISITDQMNAGFAVNSVLSGEEASAMVAPMYQFAQTGYIEIAKLPVYFEEDELAIALSEQFTVEITGRMNVSSALAEPMAAQIANEAAPELVPLFEAARSEGMANASLVSAIFVGLGTVLSLWLPNPKED